MITISKVARGSSGCLLLLALCHMANAAEATTGTHERDGVPVGLSAEQPAIQGSHMLTGEVLRADGGNYLIKEENGKEVYVRIDENTKKPPITQGDSIVAGIDDQNRALWIRTNRGTDRRTEHASAFSHRVVMSYTRPIVDLHKTAR